MYRGQKVICVNDKHQYDLDYPLPCVKEGKIYTIRGFRSSGGVYLVGIYLDILSAGDERGFKRSRFRPIDYEFAENTLRNIKKKIKEDEGVAAQIKYMVTGN